MPRLAKTKSRCRGVMDARKVDEMPGIHPYELGTRYEYRFHDAAYAKNESEAVLKDAR